MEPNRRIEIYDTTLRDGTQGEGFNLSLTDKLLIAGKLDELGVDYIEGGYPLSNPKDAAFFKEVKSLHLKTATVSAFGMTRRRGVKPAEDAGMKSLLEADTPQPSPSSANPATIRPGQCCRFHRKKTLR